MALNLFQRAVDDSMLDGVNTIWVTERQAGKTFLAHHVASRYSSVAYLCPSFPMISHHKRNFAHWNIQYFGDNPSSYHGSTMAGFGLIIADDFEHMPDYVLDRIRLEAPKTKMLLLATKWTDFLVPKLLQNRSSQLNDFVMSFQKFNLFAG